MATIQDSSINSTDAVRRRIRDAVDAAGIAAQINGRSTELTDNSQVVLKRRYLSKDREGNILEDPDGMFRRVAHNLSLADLNYQPVTEMERQATEEEFYDVMRSLEFMPNSPTLMNAGRELQQLSRLLCPAGGRLAGIDFHPGAADRPDPQERRRHRLFLLPPAPGGGRGRLHRGAWLPARSASSTPLTPPPTW